ncbi:hypothetical protein, partial [Sphingobium xenophagum]|uniref:hypothetical protein n=1 Tax=Sphingobium xenophagum TaxID=121428 RepID=UPI0005BD656A
AVMIPSTAFRPRTIALGLTSTDRKAVERQIEELIELLDTLDGDPDLEEDELHEDPCDLGEPTGYAEILPRYGADQSKGPVNGYELYLAQRDGVLTEATYG